MVGYATVYTMFPVFSLVLDVDVSDDIAMMYPELYDDLTKVRRHVRFYLFWDVIFIKCCTSGRVGRSPSRHFSGGSSSAHTKVGHSTAVLPAED